MFGKNTLSSIALYSISLGPFLWPKNFSEQFLNMLTKNSLSTDYNVKFVCVSNIHSILLNSIFKNINNFTILYDYDKGCYYYSFKNSNKKISMISNVCKFSSVRGTKPSLMKVKKVTIPIKIHKIEDKIIQLKFLNILNILNNR